jgi:hypothetical protein
MRQTEARQFVSLGKPEYRESEKTKCEFEEKNVEFANKT